MFLRTIYLDLVLVIFLSCKSHVERFVPSDAPAPRPPPSPRPDILLVPLDLCQQIPVQTLVQYLLPSNDNGSHHLVPKSKEQELATRNLLSKIFDATGRKREMINLNGLCVEHPQAHSFLETVTAGNRRGDEVGRFDSVGPAPSAVSSIVSVDRPVAFSVDLSSCRYFI